MAVTLNENIARIEEAKKNIRTAIRSKGVSVSDADHIETYASKINSIIIKNGVEIDLSAIGWGAEPLFPISVDDEATLEGDLHYTQQMFGKYLEDKSCFQADKFLVYAPKVDLSKEEYPNDMFTQCPNLVAVPSFDMSSALSATSMFTNCSNLKYVPVINAPKCQSFSQMFNWCTSLVNAPLLKADSAAFMDYMYSYCTSLKNVPNCIAPNLVSMDQMFEGCSQLECAPYITTGKVKSFKQVFDGCGMLKDLPLLDTSSCTNFEATFRRCTSLVKVPKFDLSKAVTVESMFFGCRSLKSLPLLNMGLVENAGAFINECPNLTDVEGFAELKTSMDLSSCQKLTKKSLLNIFENLGTVSNKTLWLSQQSKQLLNPQDLEIATKKGWRIE